MSVTDPIANMLTLIRNASSAKKENVDIPASRIIEMILKIFKEEGYIKDYKGIDDNKQGLFRTYLKFVRGKPAIIQTKRVSRPGLRRYVPKDNIPKVLNGLGIAILSTSQGILTDKTARKAGVGGEVLCSIW